MTDILPDFQKFLTDRKRVPSARILLYALWAPMSPLDTLLQSLEEKVKG